MEVTMEHIPNPTKLVEALELTLPLIGVYDTPGIEGFEPVVVPGKGRHACLLGYFNDWKEGKTVHLTRESAGCGGSAYWIFGKETREREDFIHFLAETEGLKDTKELMSRWLEHEKPYQAEHENIMIGPLNDEKFQYLRTVTFLVNPDQMTLLNIGAHYFHSPEDQLSPVISPFGSGCMQMLSLFKDLDYPQAIIGSMDIAMRQYLPTGMVAFTVTVPMFRQLCALDDRSFLFKPYLRNLKRARGDEGIGNVA
jgi:hypothetical protein